jgi:hypothetical protein
VQTVIEAKWIRDKPYSKQAILDDLLRLECFRHNGSHVDRYFLVGGVTNNLDSNFLKLQYRGGKDMAFTSLLLNRHLGSDTEVIEVFEAELGLRKFYKMFCLSYRVDLPKRFKTTLIARSRMDNLAVYLWKVGSMQKRSTFNPKDIDW